MRRAVGVAVLALALASGCGDRTPRRSPPADDAAAPVVPVAPLAAPPTTAPHPTAIVAVTLDRAGTAAVTIDRLGAARLWPTLDGTREPAVLPFRGAAAVDLVASDDGFVLGMLDPSGAPHLSRLDPRGGLRGTVDIAAVPPAVGLVALGPDAWLVARADQSIELYDRQGQRLADTARDGTRLDALRADRADRAVALVSTGTTAGSRWEAITLTVAGGRLVWGTPLALPVAPATPVELALSPDGTRLAYLVAPALEQPPAPPAGDERRDRPGSLDRRNEPSAVVVIDRATGAVVTPAAFRDEELPGVRRLGFVDDRTLVAAAPDGNLWTDGPRRSRTLAHDELALTAVPAISGGRRVGALDTALAIIDARRTRYVGYQAIGAAGAALSPSGARVAWLTPSYDLLIETRDGSRPLGRPAVGQVEWCAFIDEATLLVTQPTRAALVRVDDGQVLASVDTLAAGVAPVRRAIRWNPRTGWLAWEGRPRGLWTARLTGTTFGPIRQLPGGARALLLDAGDDDAPALIAVGDDSLARTFTGRELTTGLTRDQVEAHAPLPDSATPVAAASTGAVARYGEALTVAPGPSAPSRPVTTWLADVAAAAFVPGTERLLVVGGATGLLTALAPDGQPAWRVTIGAAAVALGLRADGREAVVVTSAGAAIVDVATGAVTTRRCGWLFGEWSIAPAPADATPTSVCE
ncbi:MAG: hypothetical protein R3B06_01385 [Kofleriaceae bacterium]